MSDYERGMARLYDAPPGWICYASDNYAVYRHLRAQGFDGPLSVLGVQLWQLMTQ